MITQQRLKRLKVQGYCNRPDSEISEFSFGNRFAYIICSSILLIGLITTNTTILLTLMIIAFLGIILPNHPFDYIYNYILADKMSKPKLPPRSKQLKFACTIATIGLGLTVYLFNTGLLTAGYILGSILLLVATLVSTTDICIPSIIYNFIFRVKI
ncbi:MAG TPA: hypothetical protein DHV28_00575 [Ignavibacteriales bacterium]|nr:hypothetical protein [Ignavibacteriales bacterium]